MVAVYHDENRLSIIRLLIELGADIHARGLLGTSALDLAVSSGETEIAAFLLSADPDLNRDGEYLARAMRSATNEPIVKLLKSAGASLEDMSTEMKRLWLGLKESDKWQIDKSDYLAGWKRRFGLANPELLDMPFLNEMIRTGRSAYAAIEHFGSHPGIYRIPIWCFERFGMSFTELPDGRVVQIGGEHEDFYMPDFCIYNEVVIHDRTGTFQVMGYPEEVFPPTDFHSATYVDGSIYIIGSLGYQDSRVVGLTPVRRLDCKSWRIETIQTSGDMPGWIYKHKASYDGHGHILVSGGGVFHGDETAEVKPSTRGRHQLCLGNMEWTRTATQS